MYLSVDELDSCDPIVRNRDLWEGQRFSMRRDANDPSKRFPLEPDEPAVPCGLIAKSLFNDTF